ncbi:MAG: dihydroorotate oxidase electron transfer subunit [Streptosporangiales bacterium]|nr:dihydroorotate oxidase electron transfer subunit [Streptosporangiales bacterium]
MAPTTGRTPLLDGAGLVPLPPAPRQAPNSVDAEVVANAHVGDRYWRLDVAAPHVAAFARPGQFVMVTVTRTVREGPVLPRPMAVYDTAPGTGIVTIVYSVAGAGTRALAGFLPGERVPVVGPLGRPFDLPADGGVLLLGRGIGTCSLTLLARDAAAAGRRVKAVASGRHAGAVVGADHYDALGLAPVLVDDERGTSDPAALELRLRQALNGTPPQLVAACGSRRLEELGRRLADVWCADLQVAVEAHMACGLGYCHGCATGDRSAGAETPLVCKDGPVFRIGHDR